MKPRANAAACSSGLHAGYIFAPIEGDWRFYETEISGGPDFGLTGPYIRLLIGGGGIRNE